MKGLGFCCSAAMTIYLTTSPETSTSNSPPPACQILQLVTLIQVQINHVDPFHVSLLTFVEISDGLNVETGNEEVRKCAR